VGCSTAPPPALSEQRFAPSPIRVLKPLPRSPGPLLLQGLTLLEGPGKEPRCASVLVDGGNGAILDLHGAASAAAATIDAQGCWLGPALVDPHSVLEDPLQGRAETIDSLARAAAAGGYGTVALLPWARSWRDRPERLDLTWPAPLKLALWGSFSIEGAERELAPHAEQLAAGAIGLACGTDLPPLLLLERGLSLAEMGGAPVLVAPRDASLAGRGFVREGVETLRAGWPPDPLISETLPLQSLLALATSAVGSPLRLMNLSTAAAVSQLRRCERPPKASVSWWHLVVDSSRLDPADQGWRLVPCLGGPVDREALIAALAEGLIAAVAIQHQPLDAEEQLLPIDQRRPGLAGHGLALAWLWSELVDRRGWPAELLWDRLCWGPARFLGLRPEHLCAGSRRWILFDPHAPAQPSPSLAANRPSLPQGVCGRVVASGLSEPADWPVRADRSTETDRSARRPGR
jgi:dihydroorotase